MASIRSSPLAVPSMSSENTQLVDIEQPHKHDVLSGRGVTTNKFPGNESFRSLVSLNKELYVTSTKRQKMSISRSIVEAVRSLKPPGRFLEKNPVTGMWSDIGDRKAIEKTSQALRDGAAGLRKELSEDLGDPDFLSAVFDMKDTAAKSGIKSKSSSASLKDKDKPVKAKPTKKGHRRTKSNPSAGSKAATKTFKKQKSQIETETPSVKSPSRSHSLTSRAPLSPGSPRSHSAHPGSPSGAWSMRFQGPRGPYPPPEHFKARHFHRSQSYHMTPTHHGPPRPPHPPHSWSHGPPRYPGPTSPPPNVVHTPQSPLPPGRHQLTPNGCISKPPLSPVMARWSPRHFPHHPYPPPPSEYGPGRPDYHPSRPDYARSQSGPPEFWPPHPDHHRHPDGHRRRLHYGGPRDYYHERSHPGEGLDVPSLGGEDRSTGSPSVPPEEFSPPVTPSRRRKPSTSSSVTPSPSSKLNSESTKTPDRMVSDTSEGTRTSLVAVVKKCSSAKDDATQNTAMSPMSAMDEIDEHGDADMEDCASPEQASLLKGDVHIISVVHQIDGERLEEGIEFMLKQDPADDYYSLSPLPFEREDPTTLLELPDDILHMPISSCL